jgi:hypothetical protein
MYIKKDKLFDKDENPDWLNNGIDSQDIYASLFDSSPSDVSVVQPITVEAYVRAFTEVIINCMYYN